MRFEHFGVNPGAQVIVRDLQTLQALHAQGATVAISGTRREVLDALAAAAEEITLELAPGEGALPA